MRNEPDMHCGIKCANWRHLANAQYRTLEAMNTESWEVTAESRNLWKQQVVTVATRLEMSMSGADKTSP